MKKIGFYRKSNLLGLYGLNFLLDGLCAAIAVVMAGWLAVPTQLRPESLTLPLAGAVAIWLLGIPMGLTRMHWRFISLRDLALVSAAGIIAALLLTLLLVGANITLLSPSFPALLAISMVLCLTAPRVIYRLWQQPAKPGIATGVSTAILVGGNKTAEIFLTALNGFDPQPYRVAGMMALSARHTGRRVHGLDIIGAIDQADAALTRLIAGDGLPDLLIITDELSGADLAGLLAAGSKHGVRVMRAPSPTTLSPALSPADQSGLQLQPIAIEDLLNRRQVALDRAGMARLIAGKRVLVTGAGGSIGAELARQAAGLGPASIMLLDNGEYALWQIDLELSETYPAVPRRTVLADVRDGARMQGICAAFRPELVFHAAALKHVPMVEANPLEGLRTNALGTRAVAEAASASGAGLMVLISTDKAVNPSSVMGASKRLAEMYCQGLNGTGKAMHCVTVRFGNVLGSTGSVVPLFRRQLAAGGPLTVTHPDMKRYFMTLREAVGLVLEASAAGSRADATLRDGGIFVLDMGEPVRISDLARQMIRLAGLRPDIDIGIRYTGLRAGEKLYEELFHGAEHLQPTSSPGLLMASPRPADFAQVKHVMDEIDAQSSKGDVALALAALGRLVPEFCPHGDAAGEALAVYEKAG